MRKVKIPAPLPHEWAFAQIPPPPHIPQTELLEINIDGIVKKSMEQLTTNPCRICCFDDPNRNRCYAGQSATDCKIRRALKKQLEQLTKGGAR